ncbi:MAG: aminotransferase class I/II-fold pyridoxal phosphate-dependent enzyme [Acidimicrobiales bacterium]|nr:aminotransferase class I/II-fold pyridoxal phosphate-dependent enzyme [Acidimicrobiales bacterium]
MTGVPIGLPAPGAHGGDGARVAAALGIAVDAVLDLSASLNPVAADPGPIVARHLAALGRYPNADRATAALAETMGVDRDRLLLTNGGAEAIALVGRLLGGTVDEPDFSLYPRGPVPGSGRYRPTSPHPSPLLPGTGVPTADRDGPAAGRSQPSTGGRQRSIETPEPPTDHDRPAAGHRGLAADQPRAGGGPDGGPDGPASPGEAGAADPPRWRSNPHSPSGVLAAPGEHAGVWDEAFWPQATGTWTRGDHRHGSVVVGSLTKLLACPGLRIGYLLAPASDAGDRLLAAARAAQPGWSVGGLACEALPDLLATVDLAGWHHELGCLRRELVDLLAAFGWAGQAADAPWVLVPDAGDLRARLAPHGIVVRDCTSFGLPGTVRIAVPSDEDRRRLGAALGAIS